MQKLKIGIAGVGKLGRYHGQNLSQIPAVELVGVYDIDRERGLRVADELSVDFFTNYPDLLTQIDALCIAVPTVNHFDMAAEAIRAGKSTFVEKPISSSVEQAEELIRLTEEKGIVLQVGHIERFNPAFHKLPTETLHPRFIEAHRLASFDPRGTDVAVVLDLMIHDIDLILSVVKSPVRRIDANGVSVISDNEDIANARIQFENGCVANLTASRISLKKMRKMRFFQQDMYASLDLLVGLAEVYQLKTLSDSVSDYSPISWGIVEKNGVRKQIVYQQLPSEEENALKTELQSFVDAVLAGKEPVVSGRDGLHALQVAQMILEEIKKNKEKLNT